MIMKEMECVSCISYISYLAWDLILLTGIVAFNLEMAKTYGILAAAKYLFHIRVLLFGSS